jgi:hypothetical protein
MVNFILVKQIILTSAFYTIFLKKYKPIEVIKIIENCDQYDEDKYVIKYMNEYGIQNVRGGSFVQLILPEYILQTLKTQIIMSNDLCYKCKKPGHFGKNCKNKNETECTICDSNYHTKVNCDIIQSKNYCERPCINCKKFGHQIQNCYSLTLNENCYRCGRKKHWLITCTETHDINGFRLRSHIIGNIGIKLKLWITSFSNRNFIHINH